MEKIKESRVYRDGFGSIEILASIVIDKLDELIDFINKDCMVMIDNNPNHTKSASVSLMIRLICDKLKIDMEKLFKKKRGNK